MAKIRWPYDLNNGVSYVGKTHHFIEMATLFNTKDHLCEVSSSIVNVMRMLIQLNIQQFYMMLLICNEWAERTFVDSAQASEIHLIWAVENHDVFSETSSHVLDGLCLAGPSGASRGTTHGHTQGLGKGDVASAGRKIE